MKFPEQFRDPMPGTKYATKPGDRFGAFTVPAHKSPGRRKLNIIASSGDEEITWEHVSVSIHNTSLQTATWREMCFVKDLFWDPEECIVQFHPPKSRYVNFHEGVLHLWKSIGKEFPTPPMIAV